MATGRPFPGSPFRWRLDAGPELKEPVPSKTADGKEQRVVVDGDTDEIDPAWWSDAFGAAEVDEYEPPERLSFEFRRLLEEPNLGETQRQVLEVLAAATSAMLQTGDWLHPFTPMMEIGGARSVLPSDLTDQQTVLLARIAPLIKQPSLRARVADIAWFYGKRQDRLGRPRDRRLQGNAPDYEGLVRRRQGRMATRL
jgi:hypothetical protein